MELTFGALLGLAYGICAWRLRRAVASPAERAARRARAVSGDRIWQRWRSRSRFSPGAPPGTVRRTRSAAQRWRALVLYSETLAWQTAITATYAAFAWDTIGAQKAIPDSALWIWVGCVDGDRRGGGREMGTGVRGMFSCC